MKIQVTVTRGGIVTHQQKFNNDEKGTEDSIKFLEAVKKQYFEEPYNFLFYEMEHCKALISKHKPLLQGKDDYYERKLSKLEINHDAHIELNNIQPCEKLKVKIERV